MTNESLSKKTITPPSVVEHKPDHPLADPDSERPIPTFVLVHKPPSWLLPVKEDKRSRTGAEYTEYFQRSDKKLRAIAVA